MRQKLERAAHDPYVLPHVRSAVLDALRRAQVSLDDVDGFEVHDCFTPSEYLAIDHIGLTGPGESWKAIENGEIEIGGRLPINPSGGLIGGDIPSGPPACGCFSTRPSRSAARPVTIRSREREDSAP
ncbi:3-ketoacyl-CoA thiolase domain protein [Mycobacterium kansasii]|uniref:3-ketoacyl-CoA thiolase domain protein n=1 Tax=Mycobacterium kansasii TaxID=1768 RepID=A0A1V3X8C6_MYCKA|nr:3-ketoacyl-CoA thiolase domain protein [Mycobacterium kansasii]